MCNGDCWNCELEGCPNVLSISEEIDKDIVRIRNSKSNSRYARYSATPKGYAVKRKAIKKYQQNNPNKVAMWNFRARYKKKYGIAPTDEICRKWEESRV